MEYQVYRSGRKHRQLVDLISPSKGSLFFRSERYVMWLKVKTQKRWNSRATQQFICSFIYFAKRSQHEQQLHTAVDVHGVVVHSDVLAVVARNTHTRVRCVRIICTYQYGMRIFSWHLRTDCTCMPSIYRQTTHKRHWLWVAGVVVC